MRSTSIVVTAALAAILGCNAFSGSDAPSTDPAAALPSAAPEDGGADADSSLAPVVGAPAGCDPAADPNVSPKCVTDAYGIFVDAAKGDDAQPGTKAAPAKTIAGAIGKLAGRPRIYVCDGALPERVELKTAVSLYGGFECGTWTYNGKRARIAPADAGYALRVAGVTGPMVIADLDFTAQAGTDASPSSVAAFVSASTGITLRRVTLTAQNGAKGRDGGAGATGTLVSSTPIEGSLNATQGLGKGQTCTCSTGGVSSGGDGTLLVSATGQSGTPAQAVPSPPGADGAGGAENLSTPVVAHAGSDAPPGGNGSGAGILGGLTSEGILSEPGNDGSDGPVGQGGGGSGRRPQAQMFFPNGGGCGGCGGHKGKSGAGGGWSIALGAFDAAVRLEACALTSGSGGTGGTGGAGGPGIAGGLGHPERVLNGTVINSAGGSGGHGGDGGAGGGGAGGVTAGVVFKGAKPIVDATIATGAFGSKGIGGVPGTNDGIDGVKADVMPLP